ncbi:disease resistance RPP13-like protein 4 [Carex rostrata]
MFMVLDISECYLLDYMPKWVSELSNLEVLKGFVVGSVENKNESCQLLSDLSKLSKLCKLSIRIATGNSVLEDSSGLKPLDNLLVLAIIWGGNKDNNKKLIDYLPKNLEKLDIRSYLETEATELLNPAELKKLKRLYIRGGKLTKITNDERWEVEMLHLKFLKNLKTEWGELRSSFKNLKYVEYVECRELENFPEGKSRWIKEKDEPNQSDSGGHFEDAICGALLLTFKFHYIWYLHSMDFISYMYG